MNEILHKQFSGVFIFLGILLFMGGIVITGLYGYAGLALSGLGMVIACIHEGIEIYYGEAKIREYTGIGPLRSGKWITLQQPVIMGISEASLSQTSHARSGQVHTSVTKTYKLVIKLVNQKTVVIKYSDNLARLQDLQSRIEVKLNNR